MTTSEQDGFPLPPTPPRKASGGVLALGIINIIYAILFRLCCGFGSMILMLSAATFSEFLTNLPEMEGAPMLPFEMMLSGPMRSYMMINGFVLLLLGVFFLIAGIGLIGLKPWGRTLSMGVAAAEIAWVLISFAINVFFVYPSMAQMMGEEAPQTPQLIGNVVGGIFSAFMSLVYPVVLLVCLNLQSIREQFEPVWGQQQ